MKVAVNAGLRRMDIAQIVGSIDDPKFLVSSSEVENLLALRKDNERGKSNFCADGNNFLLRILHRPSTTGLQGYVRVEELEAYKKELEALHAQNEDRVHSAERRVSEEVSKFRQDYSLKVQFDYNLDKKASRDPFLVSAMYHDDRFTYIKSAAREKPALYEIKDGKPNLINFQFENGVYIAPKVMDEGYLVIGKNKVTFKRHD